MAAAGCSSQIHSVVQILTAIDGGTPAKSGSMTIIVNVLDINDNSPIFSKTLYKASVYENVKIGGGKKRFVNHEKVKS